MRQPIPLLALALTAGLLAPVHAQSPAAAPPMFPFVIPWDDATPGTATDVSFLNTVPAGKNGHIVVKNGHFVEANTGKRICFLGTNFAAGAAFPSHADAEKVAARIAKLGINIVRMHHMDNDGWGPGQNIWDSKFKDHQHIDPGQLDKLDYLIAQLKKNGVYVNINLHVSRQFTPEDGFPASVNDIKTSYDKRVDEFDRRMIQLQKNYAHDLLTHVNPYTKLSYAADSCVAVVEINNENSLVGAPWATLGAGLSNLPEPFRGELVGFWNAWLKKKYKTDAALQAGWLKGVTPSGLSLLSPTSQWSIEHQGTSQATLTALPSGKMLWKDIAVPATINITQTDSTDWHVQAHQAGLDFKNDTTYTVSFRAKADKPRAMPLGASLDQDDWHNIGLQATANLTTDWQDFHYTFDAHDVVANHGRVAFTLGGQTGTVYISNLKVAPGAEGAGLQKGESLASKNIQIPETATKAQKADWITFLADTERDYANEMRAYLKNDLHVQANIICSQMGYGGLTSLGRNADMDFADNHAYWQHPSFPHKAWDSNDWNIPNTSMVADLAKGGGGTLRGLAEYRVAAKPYTVSEYNHPAPNDFQAETVPVIATFAAFQDWDIVYLFDYGNYGADAQNDKIQGYFGVGSNPAKMAFLPAAAMIFRAQEFPVADQPAFLPLAPSDMNAAASAEAKWRAASGGKEVSLFHESLALAGPSGKIRMATPVRPPQIVMPMVGPRRAYPINVTNSASGALYTANSADAVSAVGYVGGQTVNLGPVTMTFPQFGNNFAAVTLTAMDEKPLAQSKRMLLTLVGKVENQGMVWNADRTSVGSHWGHGPTMAEGIPAGLSFPPGDTVHLYALDGTGKRVKTVPSFLDSQGETPHLHFDLGPQDKTLWYEITR